MTGAKLPPIDDSIASAGKCCTFQDLRARALNQADTGRYRDWRAVAAAVDADNCPNAAQRLKADPILLRIIDARCAQVRDRLG